MSLYRRAAKRDQNEREIADALRQTGWSVEFLSIRGGPDLLLGKHRVCFVAEVKTKKGKLRQSQEAWHANWLGSPVLILRSVDDVADLNARIASISQ